MTLTVYDPLRAGLKFWQPYFGDGHGRNVAGFDESKNCIWTTEEREEKKREDIWLKSK